MAEEHIRKGMSRLIRKIRQEQGSHLSPDLLSSSLSSHSCS